MNHLSHELPFPLLCQPMRKGFLSHLGKNVWQNCMCKQPVKLDVQISSTIIPWGAWWFGGKVLDFKGHWFKTHRRHYVVSLSKVDTLSSSEYGFQYMTEKFLTSYLAYVIREGSDETVYLHAQSLSLPHTGLCKRTVVATSSWWLHFSAPMVA